MSLSESGWGCPVFTIPLSSGVVNSSHPLSCGTAQLSLCHLPVPTCLSLCSPIFVPKCLSLCPSVSVPACLSLCPPLCPLRPGPTGGPEHSLSLSKLLVYMLEWGQSRKLSLPNSFWQERYHESQQRLGFLALLPRWQWRQVLIGGWGHGP